MEVSTVYFVIPMVEGWKKSMYEYEAHGTNRGYG